MNSHQEAATESLYIHSLGCPKNLVDAEVMLGITKEHNYNIVTDPQNASVIIVNTCSFINDAKKESIDTIIELAKYKEMGTCRRLIMTGCLPQRYKADLMVSFPEVDAFLGTGQYGQIIDFINGKRESNLEFNSPKYIHSEHTPRINTQPFYRAYLKLSEGCMKNCAFCIIPKIRGALRSRSIPSLVCESEALAARGVMELNLIAQDLTDYGKDLADGTSLVRLLRELVKITGLTWIRLFYVYPDDLSSELVDLIGMEKKICKYLDMPIQHINDRILGLMNRRVTGNQIRNRIKKMRSAIPNLSLRSTVLVGFPGETRAEFEELKAFVKEVEFDHLGVFAYSLEEGTKSYFLPEHVDEEIKLERRHHLLTIQQLISKRLLKKKIGRSYPVIVEGVAEGTDVLMRGRYEGQAPDIDGDVLIRNCNQSVGTFVQVSIENAMEYDLIGRQID